MSQKNKKVLKYHTGFNLNIGFIVFFVIIIYVIFHIFTYFTSNPVSEYEVQQGTIATNNIYKGMIIREESVVYAEESGNLNYFVSNGSKVATSDVVYSVDTDGSIAVSYTHLDVYKRQPLSHGLCRAMTVMSSWQQAHLCRAHQLSFLLTAL